LETSIEEEGPQKYPIVSVIDERSGCAIVIGHKEVKIRLAGQISIFNVVAQAIIEAKKITTRWGVNKRIIMTDSLSNIVAQEKTFTGGNSKKMALKDLMAEECSNLKLMWVSAHVGIKGNETVDKAAKYWA
jgi:ribonuclease HI